MVSKSKTLGQSSLIFVTVGTTQFQFNRLFETLNKLLLQLQNKPNLIIQYGDSTYSFDDTSVQTFDFLSPDEIISYIKKADKIITHGGIGTMHTISEYSKHMPLTVSRLKTCGEHVNNHQQDFLLYAKKLFPVGYKKYFVTDFNLEDQLKQFLFEPPQKNLLKNNLFSEHDNKLLLGKLNDYIKKYV